MSFCDLPADIVLEHVLPLLDASDLAQLTATCNYFNNLCNDELLWQRKINMDFNLLPNAMLKTHTGWKGVYALLNNASVFTWGDNRDNRLGFNDQTSRTTSLFLQQIIVPRELKVLRGKGITSIVAGGQSFHALDRRGRVWVWGWTEPKYPLTGDSMTQPELIRRPTLMDLPDNVQIKSIASGRSHAIALDRRGHVFQWRNFTQPQKVCITQAKSAIIQVSAGWSHSAVLTARGEVFILPFPSFAEVSNVVTIQDPPMTLQHIVRESHNCTENDRFVQLACLETCVIALTRLGRVYKLDTRHLKGPAAMWVELQAYGAKETEVNEPGHNMHRFVAAQYRHFTVSCNENTLVGNLEDDADAEEAPRLILSHDNLSVRQITLGNDHFGMLTHDGTLFTWGDFCAGALGRGWCFEEEDYVDPQPVEKLSDMYIFDASFGDKQSACLAVQRPSLSSLKLS